MKKQIHASAASSELGDLRGHVDASRRLAVRTSSRWLLAVLGLATAGAIGSKPARAAAGCGCNRCVCRAFERAYPEKELCANCGHSYYSHSSDC
jgi:hypothetical protein